MLTGVYPSNLSSRIRIYSLLDEYSRPALSYTVAPRYTWLLKFKVISIQFEIQFLI